MAFVKICSSCYAGDHTNCEVGSPTPDVQDEEEIICGGWICVCSHDTENQTPFEKSIWDRHENN